ncbi:GNAT family N-acetyltransferase [Mesorhizobium sp. B292B1B]|uniref:GNAT family N-acetyltransferase n=1 Tax=unclassified Mesorhizobium TaxID=325217 RepID=UPI00112D0810|nr:MULTISPECIES: GNAT family N-acetyltransferase [unclassified Mesorhizobium]MCA0013380.1 GNAT family N-acetyltransferase [Mesorhizobium sp. B294B1A1]MCA0039797.1 GNAT family N-acetyltransferase [Mesorhizobium sp. B292B1B]TPM50355.1 GNAT family N-acetyltransferase [Mesorhizobium sp. B2-3-2]
MAVDDWDASNVEIRSQRLRLKLFTAEDAEEVFAAITPAITRFMQWESPQSPTAFAEVWRSWLEPILNGSDLHFVVRALADNRCLGLVGLHAAKTICPEIGIWIREDVHGNGTGLEAVAAVAAWASEELNPDCFAYPVAEENVASRRIAERLGGLIVETRSNSKYASVVYRIPNLRR